MSAKRHRMCHTESSKGPFLDGSRSGQPFRRAAEAISKRSREDAVGRSREAERDNDVGFVLNRLRNVYKHRRLPLLAATLAREGGARLAAWSSSPCRILPRRCGRRSAVWSAA